MNITPTPAERRKRYLASIGRMDLYRQELRERARELRPPVIRTNRVLESIQKRGRVANLSPLEKEMTRQALARPPLERIQDRIEEERISISEGRYERMMVQKACARMVDAG